LPEAAVEVRSALSGGGAQQPTREALVSSGGAEAGMQASSTVSVTAWGQTRRVLRPNAVPALLVGSGVFLSGAVTLGAIWMAGGLADAPAWGAAHATEPERGRGEAAASTAPSEAAVTPVARAEPVVAPQVAVEAPAEGVIPAEAPAPAPPEKGAPPAPAPALPAPEKPRQVEAKKPEKPSGGAARGTSAKPQAGKAPPAKGQPPEILLIWDG
jgi:hypothetical protein